MNKRMKKKSRKKMIADPMHKFAVRFFEIAAQVRPPNIYPRDRLPELVKLMLSSERSD